MTAPYLLDTNILSDIARNPEGTAADRLRRYEPDAVFTSVIVLAEINYGLARNPLTRARRQILALLDGIEVRDLPQSAAYHYATMRSELERLGSPVGANDYWIAAHAMAEDAILVSNNLREFTRVAGLKLENWVR